MSQYYEEKNVAYFRNARTDVMPLLPASSRRALEVGCGAGETMRWLKESGRVDEAWGVELFESAAALARAHFEVVLTGDAESLVASGLVGQQFDLILCLDVLEHMVDPWRCVENLHRLLSPGGTFVISVPNVRCLKVLLPLAIRGRFRYVDQGILDRTHLRFFTRESALTLAAGSALRVDRCITSRIPGTKLEKLNRWTLGYFDDLTAVQYLVSASSGLDGSQHASEIELIAEN